MKPFFDQLDNLKALAHFHILYSCWNLIDMLISGYHQEIKRNCYGFQFEDYLEQRKYKSPTVRIAKLVKEIKEKGIDMDILNYAYYGRNITGQIFEIIGINHLLDDVKMSTTQVNRSLTQSELKMCVIANKVAPEND